MSPRIGIVVGCDDDAVEDRKSVVDLQFLQDLPDKYRVDPKSHQYLDNCPKGTKGIVHADVAIAWHLHKTNPDIKVDIIPPHGLSLKRLRSNHANYLLGYDVINGALEGEERKKELQKMFQARGNFIPQYSVQQHTYFKSCYYQGCMDAGVPIAPTFYMGKELTVNGVIERIQARGWKTFIIKQSFSGFCLGFLKAKLEDVIRKPKILEDYFASYASAPEFIFQEAIPGFRTNWETRVFWWKGKPVYAIANKSAISSPTGKEIIVTGSDIPPLYLKEAIRVGKLAVDTLPQVRTPQGHLMEQSLMIRTDIGCSDTKLDDKDYNWKANKKTFFLNELEFGSINLFMRHLKFDAVPVWSEKIAESFREVCKLDVMSSGSKKRSASTKDYRDNKKVRITAPQFKKASAMGA
jgi:hypothetical protein